MTERFSLRFESGDRRGEVVGIPRGGLTIGRKPGNSLLIADNSISGKHAEITVEPAGVLLKDLGSTNGTRIGDDRILEQRLADGDVVVFGNVRLTFRDAESAGPDLEGEFDDLPVAHAPAAAPVDALERVSSDMVQRARQRSPAAAIGLGAVVLAAAGVGAWLWFGPSGSAGEGFAAVEAVPGNLLSSGYSFEGDRDTWEPLESAPAAFLVNAAARHAGAQGARADLAPGEWALHRSPAVRAGAERELLARASLRTRGATEARLGVEFLAAEGDDARPAPITAWAAPVRDASDFTDAAIVAAVPPGYASARVVVLARAFDPDQGGVIDADDVSVVESPAPLKPAAEVHGAALHLFGDPPIVAQLVRVDRVLATGIEFTRADAAPGRDGARLAARAEGPRIILEAQGAGAERPTQLVLRAERALAAAGIATLGEGGYQTAGATQERAGVESLLLGRAPDLVRLDLPAPCTVRGESDGAAVRLVVELGAAQAKVSMQLDFSADKGAAEDLAHAALAAERKGELGGAIARWSELLSRFPYESRLVDDAEATRTKLVQQGLSEVRALRADAERARFFKLPRNFMTTRARALAIAQRFAGSEVEADAKELAQALEQEVATLRQDEDRAERARLAAMLAVLEKQGSTGLAAELRARLAAMQAVLGKQEGGG